MNKLAHAMTTAFVLAAAVVVLSAQAATLDIYFIDVEGGQSTLVVTPAGESLLIDAGFPGDGTFASAPGDPSKARDAQRILAAARDAGVKQIDYLLLTHFHADHDGGVTELSQLLPIKTFIDHGDPAGAARGGDSTQEMRQISDRPCAQQSISRPSRAMRSLKGVQGRHRCGSRRGVVETAREPAAKPRAAAAAWRRKNRESALDGRPAGVRRFRFLTSAISAARRSSRSPARRTSSARRTCIWSRTTVAGRGGRRFQSRQSAWPSSTTGRRKAQKETLGPSPDAVDRQRLPPANEAPERPIAHR